MAITTRYANNRYGGTFRTLEEVPADRFVVSEPYNFNLIIGIWDGSAWVEGATPEQIEERNIIERDRLTDIINNKVDELNTRALASALGLKGSRQFLDSQRAIYQEKANVANGKANPFMEQTITDQMNRDYPIEADLNNALTALGINPVGTKILKYKALIKATNEQKENLYAKFVSYIEDFRTLCNYHLKNNDFVKAQAVIDVATIPDNEIITDLLLTTKRDEALNI